LAPIFSAEGKYFGLVLLVCSLRLYLVTQDNPSDYNVKDVARVVMILVVHVVRLVKQVRAMPFIATTILISFANVVCQVTPVSKQRSSIRPRVVLIKPVLKNRG
jgi:hypothetical protein